jgi:hypothetical protein
MITFICPNCNNASDVISITRNVSFMYTQINKILGDSLEAGKDFTAEKNPKLSYILEDYSISEGFICRHCDHLLGSEIQRVPKTPEELSRYLEYKLKK